MQLNPPATLSQALFQTVNRYPVCEAWILLLNDVDANWEQYSQAGYKRLSDISFSVEKVLNWIQSVAPASVESYGYLQTLATGAHALGTQAYLAAINSMGTLDVTLTADAINAQATLKQWDPVLGLYVPAAPDVVGLRLVQGVSA